MNDLQGEGSGREAMAEDSKFVESAGLSEDDRKEVS